MWASRGLRRLPLRQMGWARAVASPGTGAIPQETERLTQETDTLLNAAAKEGSFDKIYKIVDESGESFTERNVTRAICKLGHLAKQAQLDDSKREAVTNTRSFQTLVDMVLLGVRRYKVADLLLILDACSALGFQDDMLLDQVTTRLLTKINDLDATQLHDLVTSLGDLDSPSIVLFDALQQRMKEVSKDISADQRREMADAFEKLGYTDLAKDSR